MSDSAGEKALISVTLLAVKERELPEADDDFAQIASQFDTIKRAEGRPQGAGREIEGVRPGLAGPRHDRRRARQDRRHPGPQALIDDEVQRHLENENRLEDDVHRAEVAESSEKTFRSQILIDSIAEAEEVKVSQDELTQYLIQSAAQYGMEPGEFIKVLDENGQIPAMIGEGCPRQDSGAPSSRRRTSSDTKGKKVDVTPFIGTPSEDDEFDTSGAADLLASANAGGGHEGHDHGDHEGHDHN